MKKIGIKTGLAKKIFSLAVVAATFALVVVGMTTTVPYIQTALAQTVPGGAIPPGATTTPPPGGGAVPPGGGAITTGTTTIPSNNVTALNVYDNSTMVLEFGNGTTLASPYSEVWRISFFPAGNQTIGDATTGVIPPGGGGATVPPGGGGATVPPGGGGATVPPGGGGATVPPGGGGATVPPGGGGATVPPGGGGAAPPPPAGEEVAPE